MSVYWSLAMLMKINKLVLFSRDLYEKKVGYSAIAASVEPSPDQREVAKLAGITGKPGEQTPVTLRDRIRP